MGALAVLGIAGVDCANHGQGHEANHTSGHQSCLHGVTPLRNEKAIVGWYQTVSYAESF
jgi:hypothetical protein